ncbi:APC family permease [Anoxybacterium hadale]|uniref:APC family permease n=1 Tax=Anoxybacterium hadale TaxID=3408580 RepID=A0ACD1AEG7_9FIRM|nr:APC family permease [Clostridiales bacterium]
MYRQIKRFIIGKPLKNAALKDEKLGILWGLPILSSDAISSVAYAGQEMLLVLIPAVGIAAYGRMSILSWCIIGLLTVLMLSYRQTIDCYPGGGGAFIVAKENLGEIPGIVAGSALAVGYILTVAVSVAAGVEQVTSAFKFLRPYNIIIGVLLVLLLMVGNLRGTRESSKLFGIPTYAFVAGILTLIIYGFFKLQMGYVPRQPDLAAPTQSITMLLMLKAFASGCAALTGVEAVSNAVPNFKEPSPKYAKTVLLLLCLIILLLFSGTSLIANYYHVIPGEEGALLVLLAEEVFGDSFMFYYITASTFLILILGANTAYSGFPMLIAVMANEKYAPKQLSMRGDRLSYTNGIIMLSVVSILLIVGFQANVTSLLGLYAIGVFISFTLSQSGMFMKWVREKSGNWRLKSVINGFGAVMTGVVVVIIAIAKFKEGSWIVMVLMPVMVFVIDRIHKHYVSVKEQLKIEESEYDGIDFAKLNYANRIIVPIESVNKASVRALRYANTICDDVIAFCVAIDEHGAREVKEKYEKLGTDIPLVIKFSPYRKVIDPLLRFIESSEYDREVGDMITVLLSEFVVKKWWHRFLHNNTRAYIERRLLKHKHIVVSVMPLQLKDDMDYLESLKKKKKGM